MADNSEKFLGIIGGMGAEAGALLFKRLVELTPADVDQEHIRTLLYSDSKVPDRTQGIIGSGPSPYLNLVKAARLLENNNVDIIIIACITSHYFMAELRKEVKCKILSAVEAVIERLKNIAPKASKVGVLATTGAIKTELFHNALKDVNFEPLSLPDDLQQLYFMDAVYGADGVKAGHRQQGREKILKGVKWLIDNGAQAIISGCTELPLLFGQDDCNVPLIDAMDALIRAAIFECSGKKTLE
jgi:aspartate racemase